MCCIVSSFLRVCQKIPLQYGVKVLASSFHFRDHTSGPICRGGVRWIVGAELASQQYGRVRIPEALLSLGSVCFFFSVLLRFSPLRGNDQSPNSNSTCNASIFFKRIFRVSKCFVGIQTIFTFRFVKALPSALQHCVTKDIIHCGLCHLGNKYLRIFVQNRLKQLCKMA